jgi:2-isopropylmalate synthase
VLKNVETFEIMRPEDVGLNGKNNRAAGQAFRPRRAARQAEGTGLRSGRQPAERRLRPLQGAGRPQEGSLRRRPDRAGQDEQTNDAYEYLQLKKLRVVCGTDGPQEADMILTIDGKDHHIDATGDGPVDAAFNCVKMLFPHTARLRSIRSMP